MSDEIVKEKEVVTVDKEVLESLVTKLNNLEAMLSKPLPQEVKEEPSKLKSLINEKKEENTIKEQVRKEYELNLFFEDLPREELFNDDEVLEMDKLSTADIELEKLAKMSANDKVLKFMPNSQKREVDKVFKDGGKQDKLDFKYKFIEYYQEAYARYKDVELELQKKEKEAEERYGFELSKKGISTNKSVRKMTLDDIKNEDVKKVFGKYLK